MPLGNAFSGWHLLIILFVVLLIWGSTKLPALAQSLGKSAKILKNELRDDERASTTAAGTTSTAPGAAPAAPGSSDQPSSDPR